MSRAQPMSRAQARRVALAAQGLADPRHHPPTLRTLARTVERTGVLQVDSVNVLQRAHFMPLYSRMGPYDVDLLRRAASGRERRRLVEYWAHVQALMPVELWPVMRHRMADHRRLRGKWGFVADDARLERALVDEIRDRGPSTARELDDGLPTSKDHWGWNWSRTRRVLDFLYTCGDLAIAGRTSSFEIRYDLPERVLPAAVLAAPTPSLDEADDELVRRAARSHGVATVADLADYYRLGVRVGGGVRRTVAAVDRLVEAGELEPVAVEGWSRPAYLHRDARRPRRLHVRTLLSPFDPVVWYRPRTEALLGFRYRIEIYVPEPQRTHGYYVLPFVLGDRVVARTDLKADRPTGRLLVQSAHVEPPAPDGPAPDETAAALAAELWVLAGWLGLHDVVVRERGDLAPALAAAVGA